jgi:methionyl-tRNA formyltransferase
MVGIPLKIIFMGTPDFAVAALNALHAAGHHILAVYTQPPRPAGRGHQVQKSPVHLRAEELGLTVRTPLSLKKDAAARADFAGLKADIAVVAAYGLILPQDVLDAPKYGCLNIHASLLPRWRGAAPIQRAILAGDAQTGICIMQMEAGLDTGPVLLSESTPIDGATTAPVLHDRLADIGARLIVAALNDIDTLPRVKQDDAKATYAKMLSRDDGRIDWTQSAEDILRQHRALTPWPGLWCLYKGARLKVHALEKADGAGAHDKILPGEILHRDLLVACGGGAVRLVTVQPENRKAMDAASFVNGFHVGIGDVLS